MKKILRRIAGIPAKVWLGLFIISAIICIAALRQNNQEMVKLRDDVYTADKNDGDVNAALNNLSHYVYAHMNTDISTGTGGIQPPIQLKYTYDRLYAAQLTKLQSANSTIYTDAQNYCKNQPGAAGLLIYGEVPCVQNYIATHGNKMTDKINIPAGLYEFDFVSPKWSPDLAGWSLLVSLVFFVAFLLKLFLTKLLAKK
ncbi:MAG TPA: hypothetical protein VHD84_02980 [Candidatus Saccharimonadales bacterium]|nr:hypothetical protein [Candidatus Saccharimonadales bacterium]